MAGMQDERDAPSPMQREIISDELRGEVETAGFEIAEVVAVEGPQFTVRDLPHWWHDPRRRDLLLWAIRSVEHEPSLLGLSAHIVIVGRKP